MTIGRRFLIAGIIAIVALAAVSALGVWGTREAAKGSAQINTISTAIRNHMEADMMHDALRADVLYALREGKAGNKDAQAGIAADTADHIKNFEDHIEANKAIHTYELSLNSTLMNCVWLDQPGSTSTAKFGNSPRTRL